MIVVLGVAVLAPSGSAALTGARRSAAGSAPAAPMAAEVESESAPRVDRRFRVDLAEAVPDV
jgi:hypothetical protein